MVSGRSHPDISRRGAKPGERKPPLEVRVGSSEPSSAQSVWLLVDGFEPKIGREGDQVKQFSTARNRYLNFRFFSRFSEATNVAHPTTSTHFAQDGPAWCGDAAIIRGNVLAEDGSATDLSREVKRRLIEK